MSPNERAALECFQHIWNTKNHFVFFQEDFAYI